MFHLLVRYLGWGPKQDDLPRDRVFEYTNSELAELLRPSGVFDIGKIASIPAIIASETDGKGPQQARLGHIQDVEDRGLSVQVKYVLDPHLPPISNTELERLAVTLEVDPFEFRRTHWSVKDADLYKVLLTAQLAPRYAPTVFKLNGADEVDGKLVSVMMPFDAKFDAVYTTIRETVEGLGMKCQRADDIWHDDVIVQDIVSLIHRSRVVVCDCSARNPNVFYEIGIAHTLGRDVILMAQTIDDIPFDLRHLRCAKYLNNAEGRTELSRQLRDRITTLIATERRVR